MDGTGFAELHAMVRPSMHPVLLSFVAILFFGGCKTLGGVASGVGKVTAVAARTVAPAMRAAAKVAVPVAQATARVVEASAPVARDMGKLVKHVSVETMQAGVLIGQSLEVADAYDSGDEWQDDPYYEAAWDEEIALPPVESSPPLQPTPPSFFELVNVYRESLGTCLSNPRHWASLYFFVELDGRVSTADIIEGNLGKKASACVLKKTSVMHFPPDQSTHGLLVRVAYSR